MNKAEINRLLPYAYEELKKNNIANKQNEIDKTFRGQISSFGAAVSGGSLLAAIAFFSDQGSSKVHREYLMACIKELIPEAKDCQTLFDYVVKENRKNGSDAICKEKIINASIALKLAMNLYTLVS